MISCIHFQYEDYKTQQTMISYQTQWSRRELLHLRTNQSQQ